MQEFNRLDANNVRQHHRDDMRRDRESFSFCASFGVGSLTLVY